MPQQVQSGGLTLDSLDSTRIILEVIGDKTLLHMKVHQINKSQKRLSRLSCPREDYLMYGFTLPQVVLYGIE